MRKLLLSILFIPLCFACEKEETEPGEPLSQFHFINFVDESGENLFKSNKLSTAEFNYGFSQSLQSWEELMTEREIQLSGVSDEEFENTVSEILKNNEYLLVENFQGERERVISINGEESTFHLSPLKEGFYQNGKALQYSSDTIYDFFLFVHHIVLEDY